MARLFKIVCGLIRDLTGLYRPERHYMRGPGPAWQRSTLKRETLTVYRRHFSVRPSKKSALYITALQHMMLLADEDLG